MKLKNKQKNLIEVMVSINADKKLLENFLIDLLTPVEYAEINRRWEIIKMLNKKIGQREVSKKLGVGIATVTRGARMLKNKKGGFAQVLKK